MALFQRLKKQFHTDQSGQLKQELRWLWSQVCRYRGRILAVGLLGVLGTVMGLASSVASKYLIDAVTGGRAELLAGAAFAMAALMLLSLALHGISSRVGACIHIRVKNALQRTAFGKILRAGWESLEQYRSGDLLNRLSADVDTVCGGIINFLPSLAGSGVKFLGAFGIMLFYDPVMAVIALLGVPVTLIASRLLLGKMRDHNLKMKTLSGDVMAFQEDSFRNLTSIKAFSLTDRFENRMRGLQGAYSNAYLSYNAFHIGTSTLLALVSMTVTVSCLGWGVYQLWNGSITYGSMTMFLQLASTLRGAFQSMVSLVQQGVSLTTSAGRILAVEALPEESAALPAGLDAESRLDIRLEQVSFRYRDGDPVLEPFDFTARHGDVIAITGPSGEGKTTLLRLLLGLVQPTSGTAALHGASGAVYPLNAGTRRMFAYVPQGNSVFSGTIAENLRLVCPDATDAQLEEALRIACAWEFVSRFPEGMKHRLESGGRGVSEGQAQRLAIARALLRKAPVLLLDEVTSGLDAATERQLLENLRTCGWLQTCILVTHRAESAAFCSRCYELSSKLLTEKPVSNPGDFM